MYLRMSLTRVCSPVTCAYRYKRSTLLDVRRVSSPFRKTLREYSFSSEVCEYEDDSTCRKELHTPRTVCNVDSVSRVWTASLPSMWLLTPELCVRRSTNENDGQVMLYLRVFTANPCGFCTYIRFQRVGLDGSRGEEVEEGAWKGKNGMANRNVKNTGICLMLFNQPTWRKSSRWQWQYEDVNARSKNNSVDIIRLCSPASIGDY